MSKLNIRLFVNEDWPQVSDIYRLGLLTRMATFETEVPTLEQWQTKFPKEWIWVAELESTVVGWAGLQPVSARAVYAGVKEVTIYVHPKFAGHGIGKALMRHLVSQSEAAGVWTLHASIFPENEASIRLHRWAGFREIGYREKIARLDGVWRNTVLYERRSKIVGV